MSKKRGKYPFPSKQVASPRITAPIVPGQPQTLSITLQLAKARTPDAVYSPTWCEVLNTVTDVQCVFLQSPPISKKYRHAVVIKMSHASFIVGLWRTSKLFRDAVRSNYQQMYRTPPNPELELSEQNFPETWAAYAANLVRMAQSSSDFLIDFFWLPPILVGEALIDPRRRINEQMVEPVLRINTNIIVGWHFLERVAEIAGQVEQYVQVPEGAIQVKEPL